VKTYRLTARHSGNKDSTVWRLLGAHSDTEAVYDALESLAAWASEGYSFSHARLVRMVIGVPVSVAYFLPEDWTQEEIHADIN
jgi:hypothetical protein